MIARNHRTRPRRRCVAELAGHGLDRAQPVTDDLDVTRRDVRLDQLRHRLLGALIGREVGDLLAVLLRAAADHAHPSILTRSLQTTLDG